MSQSVRVGTAGWNYPAGKGSWNGIFYPARRERSKGFDELSYYAEHFDTVEVNTSFYGPPRPDVVAGWIARTPPGFEFSLKLHQQFTHPGMYRKTALKGLPPDALEPGVADALVRVNQADVDRFRASLDPMAEAGRLGALLAQFPASFKHSPASREHLQWLLDTFRGYPLAVELRHRSWSDQFAETFELLNAFGAAWVQIDEPKFRFSIQQNWLPNVRGFYYMRLHGRNAAQWWRHDASEDRYNYLYSTEELQPFADTAVAARSLVRKLYLYLNNHFASNAVANAITLKHMLGQPIAGTYPPEFVERFPSIRHLVNTAPVTASRTFF
jgi:uncharacterized protein YecE (DUF72 family)